MIRKFKSSDIDAVLELWLAGSIKSHDFIPPSFWKSQVENMRNIYLPAAEVYVYEKNGAVVGFYALASASVERRNATGAVRRNMPEPIPVILLSRLAVDRQEQGKGLGGGLLRDGIIRSVRAAELIGVRALLVHAIDDDARKFYSDFGFAPSPTDPMHLLLLIKDARRIVDPR